MNPSKKIPVATAVALALGASTAQPVLAQSQAGGDQKSSAIQAGPVKLTFGGFTELATIYRNRLENSDVGSDFGGLPFPTANAYYASEFRESARQSRFSLLAQGAPYNGAKAELYMETDFLSAGVTSNSRESNSYTLRMRNFYGRLTTDGGWDITAGQSWSLATLYKKGLSPRDENVPVTIDAQYVVGFNWLRNPQLRIVNKFSPQFSLGLSIDSPQAVTGGGSNTSAGAPAIPGATPPSTTGAASCGTTTTYYGCGDGAGLLNSITTYTADTKPDLVLKAAVDPGWGHYEIYGLARWFTANVSHVAYSTTGGGIGAGMILPLAPDMLNFQISGLTGKGIGRYGSSQLPDVSQEPNGQISAIKMYQVMGGLTLTPNADLTVYAYFGREKASNNYFAVPFTPAGGSPTIGYYGFGAPFGSTKQLSEVTVGEWWKFYRGVLGNAQFGLQAAYFQRDAFDSLAGVPGLSGNMFVGMASFRYYPYQN
jgi:hypothetical protein